MDVAEKVELIKRPPTKEIVKDEAELIELLNTNSKPKHYIGLEISGFLHLGSLISTGSVSYTHLTLPTNREV